MNKLRNKILNKSAVIGVIGMGYVGLPLVLRLTDVGFKTVGFDINEELVNELNEGKSRINHIDSERIEKSLSSFHATFDYKEIADCDVVIICVPTPLNDTREPDLSYVKNTMNSMKDFLTKDTLISLESTTYPGTTREEISEPLSENFEIGEDIFVCYSPEREDPGNPNFTTKDIPKVVGGHTQCCLDVGTLFYSNIIDQVIQVSSLETSEMTKLLENIHRSVNIGLVNEMKKISMKLDVDIYEVVDAAATKPFGFTPYYPGPGLGGHCIPIDPYYLSWRVKKFNIDSDFIELAGRVNREMPEFVINSVKLALNDHTKSLKGSSILLIGLAYKKNVDDARESPSLEIFDSLVLLGAKVNYHDSYLSKFPSTRKYQHNRASIDLTPENIAQHDLVLICTDHDDIDYDLLLEHSNLIVDTRGRFKQSKKVKQS